MMKKLLLIVALSATTGHIMAMDQAELTHRKNAALALKTSKEESIKIDNQTKYCLHCCATCVGCCCGLAQIAFLLNVTQQCCQNSQK